MNKETLRMQFLSGVITESEYKQKLEESKKPINENFVGIGMVGNIFDREKTDYELAFEHFTKGGLNEVESSSSNFESYLLGLFDSIDLGDEYQEGPQSYTFERMEWANDDAMGGEEAEMFNPAYEYIKSKDNVNLTDPNGIPLVFSTEEENIVVDFNTEDSPGLN